MRLMLIVLPAQYLNGFNLCAGCQVTLMSALLWLRAAVRVIGLYSEENEVSNHRALF